MVSTASFTLPPSSPVSPYTNLMRAASSHNPILCKFNFNPWSLRPRSVVKVPNGYVGRHSICTSSSSKPFFRPVMEWQDCTVKMEVDVPVSVAYKCYSDREAMPQWMPFISSVKILQDKPDQSRWTLKYRAFGRDIEFAWLARNLQVIHASGKRHSLLTGVREVSYFPLLGCTYVIEFPPFQPIPNQKIHWRSLEGLPNSGAVRFYPKGPSSCLIELTLSYEVPQILVPVASALQPFLRSLLLQGLERFSNFAKSYQSESTA